MIQAIPKEIKQILERFAEVFSERTWDWAQVLIVGAILACGTRTVACVLRVMGLAGDRQFQNYHRVLNRACWSSLALSKILLNLLCETFAPTNGPLIFGLDDTIERRRGEKIYGRGIYRDPVRSSKGFFVKTSGLRWISMMLLVPIPFAQRIWALPFFTVLSPSKRYYEERKRQPKTLIERARQMIGQLHRWLPNREIVIVTDQAYACFDLLEYVQSLPGLTMISRLRMDAQLYEPLPENRKRRPGHQPIKGKRQPKLSERLVDPKTTWEKVTLDWYGGEKREVEVTTDVAVWYSRGKGMVNIRWVLVRDVTGEFEPIALLSTNQQYTCLQIASWFVLRWCVETTFAQSRAHLGIETQRQWSEKAIKRTTPVLLGLFSLVAVLAHRLQDNSTVPVRKAAWYSKELPTFIDALALVRRHLWPLRIDYMSDGESDIHAIPTLLFDRLIDTLVFSG